MPPTQSPQSTPPVMPTQQPKKPEGALGPIFGIAIILVLILIGAFYYWGHVLNQRQPEPPPYIPGDSATS